MRIVCLIFVFVALVLSFQSHAALPKSSVAKGQMLNDMNSISVKRNSRTGYDQLYYKISNLEGAWLTQSATNKSMPKWGDLNQTYYFYDTAANEILECDSGRIFYYLSQGEGLLMGCLVTQDKTVSVISGYPLSGFTPENDYGIQTYYVAQGENLSFDFGETTHGAYALIAKLYDGTYRLILHDDEANLNEKTYESGFVAYFSSTSMDEGWVPEDEEIPGYDGSIDCSDCPDSVPLGEIERPGLDPEKLPEVEEDAPSEVEDPSDDSSEEPEITVEEEGGEEEVDSDDDPTLTDFPDKDVDELEPVEEPEGDTEVDEEEDSEACCTACDEDDSVEIIIDNTDEVNVENTNEVNEGDVTVEAPEITINIAGSEENPEVEEPLEATPDLVAEPESGAYYMSGTSMGCSLSLGTGAPTPITQVFSVMGFCLVLFTAARINSARSQA